MSASNTNLEKQKERHKGPLVGMKLLLAVVGLGLLIFVAIQFMRGDAPEGAEMQVEGTTGAIVEN